MNCTDCQNQFSDFIDDEISLKLARSFKGHLEQCPACSAEWQLFRHTITTLHSVPVQRVPAGFLLGIHEKLDRRPLAGLAGWFAFLVRHKLTAATTLATLTVAVISAAVLQLSPLDGDQTLARLTNQEATVIQAAPTGKEGSNYYPDTPYLAQNSQTSPLPILRNRVQFTPVKQSAPNSGHNSLLDPRGPPNLGRTPFAPSALSSFGAAAPDLVVTVHASSTAYQHALIRQLTSNHTWQTQITGNTLLVSLPCSQLDTFQHLFGPINPHIKASDLARLSQSSPAGRLTVAVTFH
jgi:hypothetical protein